jgi:hypothetical protein
VDTWGVEKDDTMKRGGGMREIITLPPSTLQGSQTHIACDGLLSSIRVFLHCFELLS